MKRFDNRLIPALFLAFCLIAAPLFLMVSSSLADETSHQAGAAAVATELAPGQPAVQSEAGAALKDAAAAHSQTGVAPEKEAVTAAPQEAAAPKEAAALKEAAAPKEAVAPKEAAASKEAAAPKEAAAHGEKGGHEAGLITKAKMTDFFLRIMNFVVLAVILVYFAAKPIGNSLSQRRQKVRDEIEGLEARRQEAEKAYKDLVAKLAGIEKDIKEIVDRAVAQAEKERARIIEAAEKNATDITRQSEMAVQKELLDAKRLLRDEVADRAAAMAEKIIKSSLTRDDQIRIVDQYLSKVEAVQ